MKNANDLSIRELTTIVNTIQEILFDPADKQWSPDTLDEIADVLDLFGLDPRRGK